LGHDVAEMPESQLRSVVIHELAHIRRGDFLANLLASVAMLLYWPNTLFCLRLQVLEYKIVACGDSALRLGCPKDWANHAYGMGNWSTADSTR
jgi:beta-lactamase regulating signal transducer with metallopeptidase domain